LCKVYTRYDRDKIIVLGKYQRGVIKDVIDFRDLTKMIGAIDKDSSKKQVR
jgi:hypothetical protein